MKHFLPLLLIIFLTGCSNDLDIAADWKEVPVVYGLLNPADSVQYIKVMKGFLDEEINALTIAENPDSIYYQDSIVVKLIAGGRESVLEKVDANDIGLQKDPGIFATDPNYVYRFTGTIDPTKNYQLRVENKNSGKVVTANTPIVRNFRISFPPEEFEINFTSQTPLNVDWQSAFNASIYELNVRFFYEEENTISSQVETLYVDWPIFSGITGNPDDSTASLQYQIEGESFFTFLRSALRENDSLQRRALDSPLELRFFAGGEELYNYIRVNRAQTGITQLQAAPEYTNIEGGLGIFSSRFNKSRVNVKLNQRTLDSLSCGSVTRNLNFINTICD